MKTSILSAALLMAVSQLPAQAQSSIDLLKQSIDAQGGADALRAVKSVVIKAEDRVWEVGEQYSVKDVNGPLSGDSTFIASVDLVNAQTRYDWDREIKYPYPVRAKFSEVRFPTYGAVIDVKGQAKPMSGIRHATTLREAIRGEAWMGELQLAALDAPQNVSAIENQKLGDQTFPAIQYSHGPHKFIMLFDRATKLPVAIRTRDVDAVWGDSNYDMILSDWRKVGNINIAHTRSFKLNDMDAHWVTVKDVALNAAIDPETFSVPETIKTAANPTATTKVPYQWVLRNLAVNRFMDSDRIYFFPGPGPRLDELSPNVLNMQGGLNNNMVVNMKDGLVVFEAPIDAGQSKWLIDALKAKYPGKPIKYLILSHHHYDHIGGMRAYAAEGATIIVPAPNKAYFEQVLKAPNMLEPDALQKEPRTVAIVEVQDSFSLTDDTVQINIYNIPNPHAEGYLMSHVVKENLVYIPDMVPVFLRPVPSVPSSAAVGNALRKYNITGATLVGGHGGTFKQDDVAQSLAAN